MAIYLDTSVITGLFTLDSFSPSSDALLRASDRLMIVSDFAGAEFASVVARRTRMGDLTIGEAQAAFSTFDAWLARGVGRVETVSDDISVCTEFIRRLDLNLRAPDALHIAIARRLGVQLATFDTRMADCARALKVSVVGVEQET